MIFAHIKVIGISAAVFTAAVFFVLFYRLITLTRERKRMKKELQLARLLVRINDSLNGVMLPAREKIKHVGRLLADEGEREGWRCRIVVHDNNSYLPPSGGKLGFHLPMTVGETTVGTLIITAAPDRLDDMNQKFFDALTRSIGLFLKKERQWDDFHSDLERVQASLLLQAETAPNGTGEPHTEDLRTVEQMLGSVGGMQGKTNPPQPRY